MLFGENVFGEFLSVYVGDACLWKPFIMKSDVKDSFCELSMYKVCSVCSLHTHTHTHTYSVNKHSAPPTHTHTHTDQIKSSLSLRTNTNALFHTHTHTWERSVYMTVCTCRGTHVPLILESLTSALECWEWFFLNYVCMESPESCPPSRCHLLDTSF